MSILFINNYFPIFGGADSGASNRSTMFISALAELGHVDIVSFRNDTPLDIKNCEFVYNAEIVCAVKEHRVDKFAKLFAFHSPNKIYPHTADKERIIDELVSAKHYDYIACRYIREAVECGLLKFSSKLIIDVDDNPGDVALMAAKTTRTLRNRLFNRLYSSTLDCMVKHVLKDVYCCFHSNPLQAPVEKSVYLHNVTMSNVELPLIAKQTPLQIMMVGLFHYGPNIEGLEHFLSSVWPLVHRTNPNVTLNVVGKIGDERLKEKWSKNEGVVLKGYVQDLLTEYKNSRVIIVPIYSGSGTSVKVVEAMKLNRVCVATQEGVRGYDEFLHDGEDFLLAQDDNDFAKKILVLIEDIDKCNEIANHARIMIEEHYSQSKFKEIVQASIKHQSSEN